MRPAPSLWKINSAMIRVPLMYGLPIMIARVALTWYALPGPAGHSGDVVARLDQAVNVAWAVPALRRRLADDAVVTEPMSPAATAAFVAGEVQKWRPVAKQVMASP